MNLQKNLLIQPVMPEQKNTGYIINALNPASKSDPASSAG